MPLFAALLSVALLNITLDPALAERGQECPRHTCLRCIASWVVRHVADSQNKNVFEFVFRLFSSSARPFPPRKLLTYL
jgi:hypothetical protein